MKINFTTILVGLLTLILMFGSTVYSFHNFYNDEMNIARAYKGDKGFEKGGIKLFFAKKKDGAVVDFGDVVRREDGSVIFGSEMVQKFYDTIFSLPFINQVHILEQVKAGFLHINIKMDIDGDGIKEDSIVVLYTPIDKEIIITKINPKDGTEEILVYEGKRLKYKITNYIIQVFYYDFLEIEKNSIAYENIIPGKQSNAYYVKKVEKYLSKDPSTRLKKLSETSTFEINCIDPKIPIADPYAFILKKINKNYEKGEISLDTYGVFPIPISRVTKDFIIENTFDENGFFISSKAWRNANPSVFNEKKMRDEPIKGMEIGDYEVEDKNWGWGIYKKKDSPMALIWASRRGNISKIKNQLAKGVYINLQTKDGSTALMWASEQGQNKVVKFLLEKGANVNLKAKDGSTALDMALKKGSTEIINLLKEAGAKRGDELDKTKMEDSYDSEDFRQGHTDVMEKNIRELEKTVNLKDFSYFPQKYKKYDIFPWEMMKFTEFKLNYTKIFPKDKYPLWLSEMASGACPKGIKNKFISIDSDDYVFINIFCTADFINVFLLFSPINYKIYVFLIENFDGGIEGAREKYIVDGSKSKNLFDQISYVQFELRNWGLR